MASFFGIQSWFHRSVTQLSGGQKQLLNLASILVMQPAVLILDEPTSQLDPIAAAEFLATLGKVNRELGTTIILTEHRLEEAFPMADRVAVLEGGRLIAVDSPREVGEHLRREGHPMFHTMPTSLRVWAAVESQLACPITVSQGRGWLEAFAQSHPLHPVPSPAEHQVGEETVLEAKGVWFRYQADGEDIVKGLSFTAKKGECVALLGGNGTGKTTTLRLLAGLQTAQRGRVTRRGTVGVLPQNPQTILVKNTVKSDLFEVFQGQSVTSECQQERVAHYTALCGVASLLERHPYDLSGGEQQRVALCKVLLLDPDILLLDEPTKGLDGALKERLGAILHGLVAQGKTILMVSHDIEFCASYAHRCALFFDGDMVTQASTGAFFAGNRFYTTAANRMSRGVVEGAVTVEDLVAVCGGVVSPPSPPDNSRHTPPREASPTPLPPLERRGRGGLPKRTLVATLLILLLIPITLFVGVTCFGGRKYYFIALLVLLQCMIPFFLVFEGRKPQARELVTIAVLCAIAVAGRTAFFMLPQFKPVIALCIIAGVAFGGETGFLVGAMSMLASNVLFGQGPWTPWQMFAMGIIGFLAGLLTQIGVLPRRPVTLALFGGVSAVVIYGGMMNATAALLWSSELSWDILCAYWITGLPMDLVQGVATFLFLWIAAIPMLEKLDRLKVKYGFIT